MRCTAGRGTSSGSNSNAKRMRVSGVRKSCEMPAKSVVRLESSSLTSLAMALKLAARVTSSVGPLLRQRREALGAAERFHCLCGFRKRPGDATHDQRRGGSDDDGTHEDDHDADV